MIFGALGEAVSDPPDSYRVLEPGHAEPSPTGRGVHIIVKAALPTGDRARRRNGRVEMYDADRLCTVTGLPLPGAPPAGAARRPVGDAGKGDARHGPGALAAARSAAGHGRGRRGGRLRVEEAGGVVVGRPMLADRITIGAGGAVAAVDDAVAHG